ncbi:hypothetical protein IMY05_001G0120900 [Salix suchowensis]|nr:hypothetical protein IMY05_001G0120900 [Salix suchowensis]
MEFTKREREKEGRKRRQSQGRRKSKASYCEERANRVERERYQSRAWKLKVEQPMKAVRPSQSI